MTPQTCRRCGTAPIFLAYVDDLGGGRGGGWVAFDTQADDVAGHWLMSFRGADTYSARDLSIDPAELQRARRDGLRLYVPHQLRCKAVSR